MRPYLRAANVGWSGLLLNDVKEMNFTDDEMSIYRLEPDDIVLGEASGSPDEVGKPAIWAGQITDCAFQNTLLRVRSHAAEPKYLLYFFRHLALSQAFARRSRGVGIHHIGRAALASWPVPLPRVVEQRRIVEILEDHLSRLDAADASLVTARRRLASWRKACLNDFVFRDSSASGSLRELVDRVEAGRSFGGSAPPAGPGEWGVVKVSAMTWGRFKPDENKAVSGDRVDSRFAIRSGDVLVSRANTTEYVGAPVLVEETPPNLLLSDKSLRLVPKVGVAPRWLVAVLSAPSTRQQISARATGTKDSMRNISQQALLDVEVPIASEVEQARVAASMRSADEASAAIERALDDADRRASALRRSLFAAAFSGQLTADVPAAS
jgi:type I restriction enzyme S subunit